MLTSIILGAIILGVIGLVVFLASRGGSNSGGGSSGHYGGGDHSGGGFIGGGGSDGGGGDGGGGGGVSPLLPPIRGRTTSRTTAMIANKPTPPIITTRFDSPLACKTIRSTVLQAKGELPGDLDEHRGFLVGRKDL